MGNGSNRKSEQGTRTNQLAGEGVTNHIPLARTDQGCSGHSTRGHGDVGSSAIARTAAQGHVGVGGTGVAGTIHTGAEGGDSTSLSTGHGAGNLSGRKSGRVGAGTTHGTDGRGGSLNGCTGGNGGSSCTIGSGNAGGAGGTTGHVGSTTNPVILSVLFTPAGGVADGTVSRAVSSGSHDGNLKSFMLGVGPGKNLVATNDVKIVGTAKPG